MNVIETSGLTKAFGSKMAVDQFDMHVGQGDIYGFVGRNGAGKSTVMRMLAGLAEPTGGEVRVFGTSPCEAGASRRIGALIESPGLYGSMSATDNLMMKALALGLADPKDKVRDLLDLTGLGSVGPKATKNFSMGMKQRLGLALALLGSPDLLLLDEPLNGLDPEGTRAMRNLIVRLNQTFGVTVVISSHVLDQLDRVATRFGVIAEGRMVREMTSEQMQAECGDSLRVRTVDPARSLALMEEAFPQATLRALPDGALSVAGDYDAAAVSRLLHDADQTVLELNPVRRDIEDYFVELMEGGARGATGAVSGEEGGAHHV